MPNKSIINGGLTVNTTTDGVLLPRLTTVQRDALVSPAAGLMIYNTTNASLEVYDGATWVNPVAYTNTSAFLFNYYNFI